MVNTNIVVVSGFITREPELRKTNNGLSILNFGIAVNESYKDKNGQWQNYANFFNCTILGQYAENKSKYLSMGDRVIVNGRLRYETYTNKENKKISYVKIVVNGVEVIAKRENQNKNDSSNKAISNSNTNTNAEDSYYDDPYSELDSSYNEEYNYIES